MYECVHMLCHIHQWDSFLCWNHCSSVLFMKSTLLGCSEQFNTCSVLPVFPGASFIIVVFGKKAFWVAGDFYCNASSSHWRKMKLKWNLWSIWLYGSVVVSQSGFIQLQWAQRDQRVSPSPPTQLTVTYISSHSSECFKSPFYFLAASLVTYKSWVGGKRQLLLWALDSECEIICSTVCYAKSRPEAAVKATDSETDVPKVPAAEDKQNVSLRIVK